MKYSLEELQWDSNYFGAQSAKVILHEELNDEDFLEVKRVLNPFEFVTITNLNNIPKNNYLIGTCSSAFLVDTNIQFEMVVCSNKEVEQFYTVDNFYPRTEKILQIAKESFIYSRFYNDPNLNHNLSRAIYETWVNNSFQQQDKYFIVASENDEIYGFILFSYRNKQEIVIELISIDKNAQGKGIGTKLINSLIHYAQSNNLNEINVGTQIDNLQAINFYIRNRFDIISKSSVYHYWPKKETTK